MTPEEKVKQTLILLALGKAFSEQATYLTGELRQKPKQTFNNAVAGVDLFIKTIESQLTASEKEFLQSVGDLYHNINLEIKK